MHTCGCSFLIETLSTDRIGYHAYKYIHTVMAAE
jgi:hypothetical protein